MVSYVISSRQTEEVTTDLNYELRVSYHTYDSRRFSQSYHAYLPSLRCTLFHIADRIYVLEWNHASGEEEGEERSRRKVDDHKIAINQLVPIMNSRSLLKKPCSIAVSSQLAADIHHHFHDDPRRFASTTAASSASPPSALKSAIYLTLYDNLAGVDANTRWARVLHIQSSIESITLLPRVLTWRDALPFVFPHAFYSNDSSTPHA